MIGNNMSNRVLTQILQKEDSLLLRIFVKGFLRENEFDLSFSHMCRA